MTYFSVPIFLEKTNGLDMVIVGIMLGWAVIYLVRESRARALGPRDWFFRLPPSMNFVVATLVFDVGVFVRAASAWYWRRLGAEELAAWFLVALGIGAAMIAIGGLCKIRSVTLPDYGHAPWVMTLALAVLFTIVF